MAFRLEAQANAGLSVAGALAGLLAAACQELERITGRPAPKWLTKIVLDGLDDSEKLLGGGD